MAMDIHVYDTYVKAKDGHTMHFDVITDVQDHDKAIEYAKQWLETIGEGDAKVTGEYGFISPFLPIGVGPKKRHIALPFGQYATSLSSTRSFAFSSG